MAKAEQIWTSDAADALGALWNAGVSAGEIARRLKRSRSCILGKARRIGLSNRTPISAPELSCHSRSPIIGGRPGQLEFRRHLLENYNFRCAVSACAVEQAVQAAHIIPSGCGGKFEIANGIVLRADLHALFDAGLMTIVPTTFAVLWSPRVRDVGYRDMTAASISDVPVQPSDAALHWHIANVFRASG